MSARRIATREKLVDAAVSVFAEKGVLGASVEEICEAAGFTRGAFYSNFESKNELCLAVLERQVAGHLAATHAAIKTLAIRATQPEDDCPSDSAIDGLLDRALTVFLASQDGDPASLVATAELRLYAVREASLRTSYVEFTERVGSQFVELIETTASQFGYRLTVPGPRAVWALQGVFEQGALYALITGRPDADADRIALLSGVLKSMLAPISDAPSR